MTINFKTAIDKHNKKYKTEIKKIVLIPTSNTDTIFTFETIDTFESFINDIIKDIATDIYIDNKNHVYVQYSDGIHYIMHTLTQSQIENIAFRQDTIYNFIKTRKKSPFKML